MFDGLLGMFMISVGVAVCLTGVGIPLGVLFIGLGTYILFKAGMKKE